MAKVPMPDQVPRKSFSSAASESRQQRYHELLHPVYYPDPYTSRNPPVMARSAGAKLPTLAACADPEAS